MNTGVKKLCPYCFRQLSPGESCSCAYESSANYRIRDALKPGMVVGACYQIGGVLGRGGFAITYRGYDLDLEKVVAIKEFYPEGMVARNIGDGIGSPRGSKTCEILVANSKNAEVYRKSLELFYREAKALGRLSSLPNVVHVYRIFRENNTAYIVMDYVEGKPLKTLIREMGRIPEDVLLPLLDPILTALQKVHEAGILHRDIAPDNIIIEPNGQPVLLDFGAARIDSESHSSLIIGKKGFSSPEQIGGGVQDNRSDIYALGTMYYYALSGIKPQDSVMRAIDDQVIPLKDAAPGISDQVSDVVMKAMEIRPDDRWPDVSAFREALHGGGLSVAESPSQKQTEPEQTAPYLEPAGPVSDIEQDPTQALPQMPSEEGADKKRISYRSALPLILFVLIVLIGLALYQGFHGRIDLHTPVSVTAAAKSQPAIGSPYFMGKYEQDDDPENGPEDIKWRILAMDDGRALLVSEYALDMVDFNFSRDQKITWESCGLRKWLNEDFYCSAFSPEEKERIIESVIHNSERPSGDTFDRIFLLSYAEAGEYFPTDADRRCSATAYAGSRGADVFDSSGRTRWWLRSGDEDPDSTERWAAIVWAYGSREFLSDINTITGIGVRPAMWIDLE